MVVAKHFGECPKKNYFGPKNSTLGLKKGHFGQSGPWNSPPSNQTVTYRKTKGIQSYLRIWGTYDPIESSPSEPRKGRLCGCSVKNLILRPILGQKHVLAPPGSLPGIMINMKTLFFWCPVIIKAKKLEDAQKKWIFGPKTTLLGPKRPILGNRAQKTACWAAKRPPTGKPKVSRVASWYGGLMIPLSRVRLTPKNGGYMGVA